MEQIPIFFLEIAYERRKNDLLTAFPFHEPRSCNRKRGMRNSVKKPNDRFANHCSLGDIDTSARWRTILAQLCVIYLHRDHKKTFNFW
ncbi:hypothetical protein CEXT_151181 [Caerostris extrusa]|uniref:Ycf15 n=1 Tax=Caerostris extrusa TaxID=172846 RepID=A0AAV4XX42_CAEEX|nr:hypothetical protein CEXT_151181 [Caerostris extrusa]